MMVMAVRCVPFSVAGASEGSRGEAPSGRFTA